MLFVDDEEANRAVFAATFGHRFRVLLAADAAEACDLLDDHEVDVLITDHRMSGLSGVKLCESVAHRWPHVSRILISAYLDLEAVVAAINSGRVSAALPKPWEPDALGTLLAAQVARVRQQRLVERLTSEIVLRERTEATATLRSGVLSQLEGLGPEVVAIARELERCVDELEAEGVRGATLREDVADLYRVSQRFTQLVQELHAGREPSGEVTTVQALFDAACAMMPSGVRVAISLDEGEDLELMGHASDLGRVIWNLLGNALQAMTRTGDGSAIRVAARPDDIFVRIAVSDDGPGMTPDVADRVFEPYFTTRGDAGGTGLGLAICRDLAERNGGSLRLTHSAPGRGTSFELSVVAAGGGG